MKRMEKPLFEKNEHLAAVKAIAWSPEQKELLASGGGSKDRVIRIWNTDTGECVGERKTESQVCSLLWSRFGPDLVSSHGYEKNQISVWAYDQLKGELECQAELMGHKKRVLHMAMSPDGQDIVSAAADETLRFWKVFDAPE